MLRDIPSLPHPRLGDLAHAAIIAGLPRGASITLLEFAKKAEADGTTMESVRGVARNIALSSGTVAAHVGTLVELGFLELLGRSRLGNRRRQWRVAGMKQSLDEEISTLLRAIPSTSPDMS
jgi:hypothetical protein